MAEEHPQRPEEISGHDQAAATDAEHAADQSRIFDSVRQNVAELRAGLNALTERIEALDANAEQMADSLDSRIEALAARVGELERHAHMPREPDQGIGLP